MKKKIALIFGITGQDGSYLANFLINKGYLVHGVKRRSSSFNTGRIDHLYQDPHERKRVFFLHHGDITDSISVSSIILSLSGLLSFSSPFFVFSGPIVNCCG